MLNLLKKSYMTENNSIGGGGGQQQFDLKTFISLAAQMDATNMANNTVTLFNNLKVDAKMKWDQNKPVRLNQDNQREDDLRRLREINSYLARLRVTEAEPKPKPTGVVQKQTGLSSGVTFSSSQAYPGGMYFRIENEWKQRNS